jgi:hypothetical protein
MPFTYPPKKPETPFIWPTADQMRWDEIKAKEKYEKEKKENEDYRKKYVPQKIPTDIIYHAETKEGFIDTLYYEFNANNQNINAPSFGMITTTVYVIEDGGKNYVVGKIYKEKDDKYNILYISRERFFDIIKGDMTGLYSHIILEGGSKIKYGTARGTGFHEFYKAIISNKVFPQPESPTANKKPYTRSLSASRLRRGTETITETPTKTNYQKIQEIIKDHGPYLAILIIAILLKLSMSNTQKGGEPSTNGPTNAALDGMTKEELEGLLKEIIPEVKKEDLKKEIENLNESEKKAVEKQIDKYFPGFNLQKDETVFGNLFGNEGGKRRRTNKNRRTNKRRNNKKKSNRR